MSNISVMVFKNFVHFGRNAHLAKNLWTSTNNPSQPGFFVSTKELPRLNNQLVLRQSSAFGNDSGYSQTHNEYAPHNGTRVSAGLVNNAVFSTHAPLNSLDEDIDGDEFLQLIPATGGYVSAKYPVDLAKDTHRRADSILLAGSLHVSPALSNGRRFSTSSVGETSADDRTHYKTKKIDFVNDSESSADTHSGTGKSSMPEQTLNDGSESEPINLSQPHTPISTATRDATSAARVEQTESVDLSNESAIVDDDEPIDLTPRSPEELQQRIIAEKKIAQRLESQKAASTASEHLKTNKANRSLKAVSAAVVPTDTTYDISPVLEHYFTLLKDQVVPNTETYSILLSDLLKAATFYTEIQSSNFLLDSSSMKRRHGPKILPSSTEQFAKFSDGKQYYILALDLLAAANSVKHHNFSFELYKSFITSGIAYKEVKRLPFIVSELSKTTNSFEGLYPEIIRAFGMAGDISRSLEIYERYKKYVVESDELESHTETTLKVYGALVSAYFACGLNSEAILFLGRILTAQEPFSSENVLADESFEIVLSSTVESFIKQGDYDEAWKWIKNIEADRSVCSISLGTIGTLFSSICVQPSQSGMVEEMFDYMASQVRSITAPEFNKIRSDYIMNSIRMNKEERVLKALKECQLRGGFWDPVTIVNVVEYLSDKKQSAMAVDVFLSQSRKLKEFLEKSSLTQSFSEQTMEMVTAVSNILSSNGQLDLVSALSIADSDLSSTSLFTSGVSNPIVETILSSPGHAQYEELKFSSQTVIVDAISSICRWLDSSKSSLGNLSLPSDMVSKVSNSLDVYLKDAIYFNLRLDSALEKAVIECLDLLGSIETKSSWQSYMDRKSAGGSKVAAIVDSNTPFAPLLFDINASRQIMGYANTRQGLHKAFEILDITLTAGNLVVPESICAIISQASSAKNSSMLAKTYSKALEKYPYASYSPQAWDIWVAIHRSVVEHAAEIDYSLARQAHINLLQMGSSPDATGYGKLISLEPINSTRNEAGDALLLFQESRNLNVFPNTFLYNVLLSKLSKARRLNECFTLFEEMDVLGVKKSSISYGTMISACCRAGDENNAKRLFQEMEESPFYVPKVAPFNILLQFYGHTKKDRQEALKVYQRMISLGIEPSAHTYKLLIDLYTSIEPIDLDAADNVLLMIQKSQQVITSQHFASLIYARGVLLRDLPAAKKFYDGLVLNNRVRPDKVILQALLESYIVNGKVAETSVVLDSMLQYGVDYNAYMANILIRGWAPVDMDKSVSLFNYVLNNNIAEPSSYESMVRVFIYHKDIESATSVVSLLSSNGYPEPVVHKVRSLLAHYLRDDVTFTENEILLESIFRPDVHQVPHAVNGGSFVSVDTHVPVGKYQASTV